MTAPRIDPGVDIGHVHLKVADSEPALDFYCGALGSSDSTGWVAPPVRLRPGVSPLHRAQHLAVARRLVPSPGHTGLFHVAIRYPERASLADALHGLVEARAPIEGACDHGVSEAIYLRDPDG